MKTVVVTPLLRAVGLFDLIVTAVLAIPLLSDGFIGFIGLIDWIGTASGLAEPLPPFPALAMFLVNLAGVLGVCWNLMILRTASDDMLRVNIVARWIVAALIVYYVTLHGMTCVVLVFAITEIIGSLVELHARRSR